MTFALPLFAPLTRTFAPVNFGDSNWQTVLENFNTVIAPIYGNQANALDKIAQKKDRICELLFKEKIPVGLLVYKNILSNEHSQYGINQSIEVKTLMVIDSNNNSGKGLGTDLINRVQSVAETLKAQYIHVTVSETKEDALAFFQKKNFKTQYAFDSLYKKGVTEYLLARPISG